MKITWTIVIDADTAQAKEWGDVMKIPERDGADLPREKCAEVVLRQAARLLGMQITETLLRELCGDVFHDAEGRRIA